MVTECGWSVEQIMLNDRPVFRVRCHGLLVKPSTGRNFTSVEQLREAMGEAFARLHDELSAAC